MFPARVRRYLICVMALLATPLFAEDGLYVKRFFGFDNFLSGQSSSDGGYLAALELNSDELYLGDTALVRLSSTGVVRWKRILSNTLKDHIYGAVQTSDGGWIVTGDTYECPMSRLCYRHPVIIRLDASGKVVWQKTMDTVERDASCCSSIMRFAGDGVLLAGSILINNRTDALLIALDADGRLKWARSYGSASYDRAVRLIPACSGGAFIFGDTEGGAAGDLFVMRVNRNGVPLWSRRFQTPGFDYIRSAAASGCGSYVGAFAGPRGMVLRLDHQGKPVWKRAVTVRGQALRITTVEAADGVLVAGTDRTAGVLVKLDPSGRVRWARRYANDAQGEIGSIARNSLGGFNMAGSLYSSQEDALFIARIGSRGQGGRCSILAPVAASSRPITVRSSLLRFQHAPVSLQVTDLKMRYRSQSLVTSVCR